MLNRLLREFRPLLIIILFFILALVVPGGGESETVSIFLGVVGLLFAILVGFYINDLWSRYQTIRTSVAVEVSGIQTYYLFVKIIANFPGHTKWAKQQKELIDNYVKKFFEVEWDDYGAIDPHFNAIIESLKDIGDLKTNNEIETYSNMHSVLNEVTTAREKLFMYGKDKLSAFEWSVVYLLASILLFSIFFINDGSLPSLVVTGALSSAVVLLILVLRDLNNMSYGEEFVSFEPYETIFDVIGMPRYYRQIDIDRGRAVLPEDGTKYRLEK